MGAGRPPRLRGARHRLRPLQPPRERLPLQPLLDLLTRFAREKEAAPAQISLAWMLHKKDFIVPIPGSRKQERIENLGAAEVELSDEEFRRIESGLAGIEIHGDRTDEDIARLRTLG